MIEKNSPYFKQAELVVQVLPWVAKYECFALKGGTAINLFIHNLPRLSVDIDLTYLPIQERKESLDGIENALKNLSDDVEKNIIGSTVQQISMKNSQMISKLVVVKGSAQVKIEPNLVIRGTVFPCSVLDLSAKAKETFEMSVAMKVVSLSDLYGGKICAALDRQHPRDLYDIKFLLENEGISEQIRKGFLVYLISHDRPMAESLNPIMKDMSQIYETDFQGMTDSDVSYEELVHVRGKLVKLIKKELTKEEKEFLISFKQGDPDWSLLGVSGVEHLPAVRWKLYNVQKMSKEKRNDFVKKFRNVLA